MDSMKVQQQGEYQKSHTDDGVDTDSLSLEDFVDDEELKAAYNDPDVSTAFQEMQQNPSKIEVYYENPKIKHVIQLIKAKCDPDTPTHQQHSQFIMEKLRGESGRDLHHLPKQMGEDKTLEDKTNANKWHNTE